jgi:hypothetical protein
MVVRTAVESTTAGARVPQAESVAAATAAATPTAGRHTRIEIRRTTRDADFFTRFAPDGVPT